MSLPRKLGAFLWDFVVGDDWVSAAGIILALGATAVMSRSTSSGWWILPLAVIMLLALYLWRTVRGAARRCEEASTDERAS